MSGMLTKYFGHQDVDLYGEHVAGRSLEGYPILGNYGTTHIKQAEMENLPLFNTFHAEWFCLWVPEDKAKFCRVMDHVYNGEFFVKNRLDIPVDKVPTEEPGGSLKIWLEWVQVVAKLPAELAQPSPYPLPDSISFNIPIGGHDG